MKAKKISTMVDAQQWTPGQKIDGVVESYDDSGHHSDGYATCTTIYGRVRVRPGDWVITDSDGNMRVVSNEIFLKEYEEVPLDKWEDIDGFLRSQSHEFKVMGTSLDNPREYSIKKLLETFVTAFVMPYTKDQKVECRVFETEDKIAAFVVDRSHKGRNWLIYSNEHGAWWKPDSRGYTRSIDEAGRYTEEEARDICNEAGLNNEGIPQEVMVEAPR